MADTDIDPFGEHELRPEGPNDEHISLSPVTPGGSTWEPTSPLVPPFLLRSDK